MQTQSIFASMTNIGWIGQPDLGQDFRFAWAGGDTGPRSELRSGLPLEMAEAFVHEIEIATDRGEDVFALPISWIARGYGALVSDMDSTLIKGESLDELADALGVGEQVAAITARSMRGELDFAEALSRRFDLIKGVPRQEFIRLGKTTRLSTGAKFFIESLAKGGTICTLATGGFDIIAETIVARLGMHDFVANALAFNPQGNFEGRLAAPILDADAKRKTLLARKSQAPQQLCLAMGDGANDLAMIEAADVGIAYRAKPIVRQATAFQLNHASFFDLPFLLGIT